MNKIFAAIAICFMVLNSSYAAASDFTQEGATKLFTQMVNTLNTRNPDAISKFFAYYMASDAVFYKKSILVTPGDLQNPKSIKDIQFTRDQYISLMQSIVKIGRSYKMNCNIESFQVLPDKYVAYVGVSMIETSVIDLDGALRQNIVSTNCNYTLIDAADSPKIAGANCIEKIILEQ